MFDIDIESIKQFAKHFTGGKDHPSDYHPDDDFDPLRGCRQGNLPEKDGTETKYIGIQFKF